MIAASRFDIDMNYCQVTSMDLFIGEIASRSLAFVFNRIGRFMLINGKNLHCKKYKYYFIMLHNSILKLSK